MNKLKKLEELLKETRANREESLVSMFEEQARLANIAIWRQHFYDDITHWLIELVDKGLVTIECYYSSYGESFVELSNVLTSSLSLRFRTENVLTVGPEYKHKAENTVVIQELLNKPNKDEDKIVIDITNYGKNMATTMNGQTFGKDEFLDICIELLT